MRRMRPGGDRAAGGGMNVMAVPVVGPNNSSSGVVAVSSSTSGNRRGRNVIYPTATLRHSAAACNSSPNSVVVLSTESSSSKSQSSSSDSAAAASSSTTNANTSSSNVSQELVFASHLSVNIARKRTVRIPNDTINDNTNNNNSNVHEEQVWSVDETLRTSTQATYLTKRQASNTTAKVRNVNTVTAERVITCIKHIPVLVPLTAGDTAAGGGISTTTTTTHDAHHNHNHSHGTTSDTHSHATTTTTTNNTNGNGNANDDGYDRDVLLVGFSDGSLTSWIRTKPRTSGSSNIVDAPWKEYVLVSPGTNISTMVTTATATTATVTTATTTTATTSSEQDDGEDGDSGGNINRSITDIDGFGSILVKQHDPNDDDDEAMTMMCATRSLLSRMPPGVLQNRGISLSTLCIDCPLSKTLLQLQIVVCTSGGSHSIGSTIDVSPSIVMSSVSTPPPATHHYSQKVVMTPANVVKYRPFFTSPSSSSSMMTGQKKEFPIKYHTGGVFLVGTAAPRHNKIHAFHVSMSSPPTPPSPTPPRPVLVQSTMSPPSSPPMLFFNPPVHVGQLIGHEDWITCFDWYNYYDNDDSSLTSSSVEIQQQQGGLISPSTTNTTTSFLASGSQDAKIRLWKWATTKTTKVDSISTTSTTANNEMMISVDSSFQGQTSNLDDDDDNDDQNTNDDDDDDDDDRDDEEMIEGEARLEFTHTYNDRPQMNTAHESTIQQQQRQPQDSEIKTSEDVSVFLEALLIGHEDKVTSVAWHPCPQQCYRTDLLLISASMDRTIFLWCEHEESGVWTPITRVGSAGGILGGSIGSSLLGFLNVQVDPLNGSWILGHAYGGALHFFSCDQSNMLPESNANTVLTIEDRAAFVQWRAQPCLTGHFAEVTDLSWEASSGMYLLTAGNDQTCRLWAPVGSDPTTDTWLEIARPQVHGYNLSAVVSLSTARHPHLLVTGADEKEIRVFDGTLSFIRQYKALSSRGIASDKHIPSEKEDEDVISSRVERAYVPALGLSNKASAADGAEEDTGGASSSVSLLPLERDLGSVSLFPEIRKLYGHTHEITRLTSTLQSRTSLYIKFGTSFFNEILVASSTIARDVETASIRIWDVNRNRCLQNLKGGHRSTVTAMSFSPDGMFLATSGKDRRLCLWQRKQSGERKTGEEGISDSSSDDLFSLVAAVDSSHKRIVWSVQFCPYDPTVLVSGSRDGTVKLWKIATAGEDESNVPTLVEYSKFIPKPDRSTTGGTSGKAESVTSLAFAPVQLSDHKEKGLLAIGFENGLIQLWKVPLDEVATMPGDEQNTAEGAKVDTVAATVPKPTLYLPFRAQICHLGAVNKLAWRPTSNRSTKHLTIASCSEDHGCRIFEVQIAPDE